MRSSMKTILPGQVRMGRLTNDNALLRIGKYGDISIVRVSELLIENARRLDSIASLTGG
jgi:hypothetical protein